MILPDLGQRLFRPLGFGGVLEALLKVLGGRVVVVWDGGDMHKGDPIAQLQDVMAERLSAEKFPSYALMF